MQCSLCGQSDPHEHNKPIHRMIDGLPERSYYATVRGINRADETGYAMVNTELSQVFVPVFVLSPNQAIWVQDDYAKPLTPEQFHALYPGF